MAPGTGSPLHVVDVAHPPMQHRALEEELLRAWLLVRHSPVLRLVKIIHGYGSSGKGGATKEAVRDWAFRHRDRMQMIIEGEEYSLYHAGTQEMVKALGWSDDPDLRGGNPGITILWVK